MQMDGIQFGSAKCRQDIFKQHEAQIEQNSNGLYLLNFRKETE